MEAEELKTLIKEVLKDSPEPLSSEGIAEAILARLLKSQPNLVPQPLYNPAETYRSGQRVYHAYYEAWFVVQGADKQNLSAKFEDGIERVFRHNAPQQSMGFPITPEAYLVTRIAPQLQIQGTPDQQADRAKAYLTKLIEPLLSSIPGLYRQDDLWHDRPIESPVERACRRYQIRCFYHITHIENLDSILSRGILCKNKLKPGDYRDISEQKIQERRHNKPIPQHPGLTLHDCVPLFFAPKPPMLSARRELQEKIIYLHIDPHVLDLPNVVFTDGNARSERTAFYDRLEDLKRLDWEILRAKYWGDNDENSRRRAAEVLVPDCIPVSYIQRITVMTPDTRDQAAEIVRKVGRNIPICEAPNMYFPSMYSDLKDDELPF